MYLRAMWFAWIWGMDRCRLVPRISKGRSRTPWRASDQSRAYSVSCVGIDYSTQGHPASKHPPCTHAVVRSVRSKIPQYRKETLQASWDLMGLMTDRFQTSRFTGCSEAAIHTFLPVLLVPAPLLLANVTEFSSVKHKQTSRLIFPYSSHFISLMHIVSYK